MVSNRETPGPASGGLSAYRVHGHPSGFLVLTSMSHRRAWCRHARCTKLVHEPLARCGPGSGGRSHRYRFLYLLPRPTIIGARWARLSLVSVVFKLTALVFHVVNESAWSRARVSFASAQTHCCCPQSRSGQVGLRGGGSRQRSWRVKRGPVERPDAVRAVGAGRLLLQRSRGSTLSEPALKTSPLTFAAHALSSDTPCAPAGTLSWSPSAAERGGHGPPCRCGRSQGAVAPAKRAARNSINRRKACGWCWRDR